MSDPVARIERVEFKQGAKTAAIFAGGRRVATIAMMMLSRVDVTLGTPWTEELERAVARANEIANACGKMIRLHTASPKSSRELRERLEADGIAPDIVDEALAILREAGLIDDQALAASAAERLRERGESGAASKARLRRRGLSFPSEEPPDETARAVEFAKRAAAKLPANLEAPARWRRLLAALGRRGYDEQTAMEAATRVLGRPPIEPAD